MVPTRFLTVLFFILFVGKASGQDPLAISGQLILRGDFQRAIQSLDSMQVDSTRVAEWHYLRGQANQGLYKLKPALDDFVLAYAFDSLNTRYALTLANHFHLMGRIHESTRVLEFISRVDTTNLQVQLNLARNYAQSKNNFKAYAVYARLLEKDSMNYYYHKLAGNCLYSTDSIGWAIYHLEQAVDISYDDLNPVVQLGNLYMKIGMPGVGLIYVNRGLDLDSTHVELLKLQGYLGFLTREFVVSIKGFERAIQREDSSVFVCKYLGKSYLGIGQYDNAIRCLEYCLKRDTLDHEVWFDAGVVYRHQLDYDRSVKYLKESVDALMPDPRRLALVYYNLGDSYRRGGKPQEAIDYFRLSGETNPQLLNAYLNIAQVYDYNLKDLKSASRYYQLYLTETRQSPARNQDIEEQVLARLERIKEELHFRQ
jgi:tetratricopeptide (TPR) repeat protein